jgi:predicted DNA-binding transcriptional regulator AlpA
MTATAQTEHDRMEQADIISLPEAARRIGVHPETLYRLARNGDFLPAVWIGGRWKCSVPRLERFLHGEPDGQEAS